MANIKKYGIKRYGEVDENETESTSQSNIKRYGTIRKIDSFITNPSQLTDQAETSSENKKTWLSKGALDDGYQFGDIFKSALATVGDIGINILSGIASLGEGVVDTARYGIADISKLLGNDTYASEVKERANQNTIQMLLEKPTSYLDKYSVSGEIIDGLAQGVGQVAGMYATAGLGTAVGLSSKAAGAASLGTMGVSAYGSGRGQAYSEGATDKESRIYGAINAAGQVSSELLFGGLGKGINALGFNKGLLGIDDLAVKALQKKITSQAGKSLIELAIKSGGEGLEEVASGLVSALGKKLSYASEEDYKNLVKDENLWESFYMGALTSAIIQSPVIQNKIKVANSNAKGIEAMIENGYDKEQITAVLDDKGFSKEDQNSLLKTVESKSNIALQLEQNTKINNLTVNEINNMTNLNEIESAITNLNNFFTSMIPVKNLQQHIENTYDKIQALTEKRNELNSKLKEQDKIKKVKEIDNALELTKEQAENLNSIDKEQEAASLSADIDKNEVISTMENVRNTQQNKPMYIAEAQNILDEYLSKYEDTKNIEIKEELTDAEKNIEEVGAAFGKQVVFLKGAPFSGVTTKVNPNIIFINDKINSGLLSKTKNTNKMLYTVGHEMFHSMNLVNPEVYNQFIEYVKQDITIDNLLEFMQMYDSNDSNKLLESLQIDGNYDLEKIISDKEKYKKQNQALNYVLEEMVANEFGNMFTDEEYMTKLKIDNPSLFTKIINAIKDFFKSINKPIYKSNLSQLQIQTIQNKFEEVVSTLDEKGQITEETKKIMPIKTLLDNKTNTDTLTDDSSQSTVTNKNILETKKEIKIPTKGEESTWSIQETEYVEQLSEKAKEAEKQDNLNNMYYRAREIYSNSLETDNIKLKNKANNIYNKYKEAGGTKLIDGLEENIIEKPVEKLPKKELNINQEPKQPTITKPKETKEIKETKPEDIGKETKTITMDMDAWYARINDMLVNANKLTGTKHHDALKSVTQAYNNYKAKGGTKTIDALEDTNKLDFKDKLLSKMDVKKLPNTDSNGNKLYKEQQEYFKDSKVRDENGNLLTVYHRTNAGQFTEFKNDKNINFFTDDDNARAYGNTKFDVYLNIKNPLIINANSNWNSIEFNNPNVKQNNITSLKTIIDNIDKATKNDIIGLARAIDKHNTLSDIIDEFETPQDALNAVIEVYTDTNTIDEFIKNFGSLGVFIEHDNIQHKKVTTTRDITEFAKKQGYDGVIFKNIYDMTSRKATVYATLVSPNQIKNIDNTTPTTSNDIRYLPTKTSKFSEMDVKNLPSVTTEDNNISKFYDNTIKNSQLFEDVINNIDILDSDKNLREYTKTSHSEDMKKAVTRLQTEGQSAIYNLLQKETLDSVDSALAALMMTHYKVEGNIQEQVALATKIREQGTKAGQFIDSLKIFKLMDPTALSDSLQKTLTAAFDEMYNSKDPTIRAWLNSHENAAVLTTADRAWIENMATEANKFPIDSDEYKIRYASIYAYIADRTPKTLGEKITTFRRLAMLSNFKTQARNVLGNVGVAFVNPVTDYFGSKLDKYLSKKSGVRTTGTLSKEYLKGIKEGVKLAKRDVDLGINTSNLAVDYHSQRGKTFNDKSKVGKVLNWVEKWTNFGLDLGDRPFETAAYENSLQNQMKLNNVTEATDLMKQIANEEAQKRTWKNNSKLAQIAISTRQTLDKVKLGGKNGIGLGQVVMPFVMTPANLAVATYEYSPLAAISVGKAAKTYVDAIKNGTDVAIAQKNFVDSFGKATTGTILYAIAYALAKSGAISGDEDEDKDIRALMKAQGYQPFSIKIGNKSFTYDWAQPLSSPFAVMAELNRTTKLTGEKQDILQSVAKAFEIGGSRLYEQSFLQSIKTLFDGDNPLSGAIDLMSTVPASFVPTIFKQTADIIDSDVKSTYSNNAFNNMINKVMVKLPGIKSLLPTKTDVLGNEIKMYGGNSGLFNTFISPANVSEDLSGAVGTELMDVYNTTGEKQVMPQVSVSYIDYDTNDDGTKERINLDLKQQSELQKLQGEIYVKSLNEMMNNKIYNEASYENKATALISLAQYSKSKAIEQSGFVDNYKIKSGNAAQINNYVNSGLTVTDAVMYDSMINPIKSLKDENDETIPGSENGQKAYNIMNMSISDEQKNVMLQLISPTSKNPETVDSLSTLQTEEQYINYYSLSRSDYIIRNTFSRNDYDNATQYYNFDGTSFVKAANDLSNIKSDYDAKGNVIEGSKKKKIVNYINTLELTQLQKIYLYKQSGYSVKSWKSLLFSYINSLNTSSDEKQRLWEDLGLK